jgi:uncharacterized protein YdaU (DUF1376 family)
MPLFIGDFLSSTAEWTGEERGLYLQLLAHQWSLVSLPTDPSRLCRLVAYDQQNFSNCWEVVRCKFNVVDGRLYNHRLEDHRAKSVELSSKRSAAGKKGSEERYNGKSEAHHKQLNGNSHEIVMPSTPLHPTPSESTQIRSEEEERTPKTEHDYGDFLSIRKAYPPGDWPDSHWLEGERAINRLLSSGETVTALIDAAHRYSAQMEAKGDLGTQFVRTPAKFFDKDGFWRGSFPLPKSKADKRLNSNISAAHEFMDRTDQK